MEILQQPRRTASIQVQPYLAEYARRKFSRDPQTGGIVIPDSFNLYHCVWQSMSKWPLERWHVGVMRRVESGEGNLLIHLPDRHREGGLRKDPRYWNYLPPRAAHEIGRELKRLFDWEFHHYMEQRLKAGDTKVGAVREFARLYGLGIDAEDTLLKNFQRYERRMGIFLRLNKVKSARLSTPTLSCRVPALLRLPEGGQDGPHLSGGEGALFRRAVAEGLELLGQARTVVDPVT